MKVNRHTKILELIQKYNIETQEELAEYLNRDGFQVTQATVSRDIRDLKLTKIPTEGGRQKYSVIHHSMDHGINEKYMRILKDGFMSIDVAGNLLVIKTAVGMAMAVAAAIDALKWPEILGSIAGDDTIFCAARTEEDAGMICVEMEKLVK